MATAVGGTHPTGMHSCFYVILIFLSVLVLPGERLVKLIHQDSQDDMAASIAGSFDGMHSGIISLVKDYLYKSRSTETVCYCSILVCSLFTLAGKITVLSAAL